MTHGVRAGAMGSTHTALREEDSNFTEGAPSRIPLYQTITARYMTSTEIERKQEGGDTKARLFQAIAMTTSTEEELRITTHAICVLTVMATVAKMLGGRRRHVPDDTSPAAQCPRLQSWLIHINAR